MQNRDSRNLFERLLGLCTEVRGGEGATVLLLFLNLFLVLMSYYTAKVLREAWILAESCPEVKSYLSAGQVLLILVAVRFFEKTHWKSKAEIVASPGECCHKRYLQKTMKLKLKGSGDSHGKEERG